MPAILWLALASTWTAPIAAAFACMLIFGELGWVLNRPLTENELATMRWGCSMSAQPAWGVGLLFSVYMLFYDPYWRLFWQMYHTGSYGERINPEWILPWWVFPDPARYRDIYIDKIWWDWQFMKVHLLGVLSLAIVMVGVIALSIIARHQYLEIERLPFPTGVLGAEIARALGERRQPEKVRWFLISSGISFFYMLIYQIIPTATDYDWIIIPINDWQGGTIDFSQQIQGILPGAIWGIMPHLLLFSIGFIVTFDVALGMFASSYSMYVFGSWFIVRQYGGLLTILPPRYYEPPYSYPGYHWTDAWLNMVFDWGISLVFGTLLAGTFIPFFLAWRSVTRGFKDLMNVDRAYKVGVFPLKKLLIVWAILMGIWYVFWVFLAFFGRTWTIPFIQDEGYVSNLKQFVDSSGQGTYKLFGLIEIPGIAAGVPVLEVIIAIFIITFLISWIKMFVAARTNGETGIMWGAGIPYLGMVVFWTTGYTGIPGWFMPWGDLYGADAGSICVGYKAAQLTHTNPRSIMAAHLVGNLFAAIFGLMWGIIFWVAYGIGSAALPTPFFPVNVIMTLAWASGWINFIPMTLDKILLGLIIGALAFMPRLFIGFSPISPIGLNFGFIMYPHETNVVFLGAIARWLTIRMKGREWFSDYGMSIGAGMFVGYGIATIIDVVLRIIIFWFYGFIPSPPT